MKMNEVEISDLLKQMRSGKQVSVEGAQTRTETTPFGVHVDTVTEVQATPELVLLQRLRVIKGTTNLYACFVTTQNLSTGHIEMSNDVLRPGYNLRNYAPSPRPVSSGYSIVLF